MLNIKLFITYSLILLGLVARAQTTVLPLDTVLQRIAKNNPMLQEYNFRAQAQNAMAEGAKSQMAPMVGAGVFMFPNPGQMPMPDPETGMLDQGMFMVSAEQDIIHPAKLRAKQQYQLSKAAIEEAGRDLTFNKLRAEARTAYYQAVVLEKSAYHAVYAEAVEGTISL